MEVEKILHMSCGEGDSSYSNNSVMQRGVIFKAKPQLEQSLLGLYNCNDGKSPTECIRFADMGCSSGPNSLLPTWAVIEALDVVTSKHQQQLPPPVLHVFLNDLPGNDFNAVCKSLPSFYERLEKKKKNGHGIGSCFIAAVPGSFFGRLFPPSFLHLVYSSSSLHWLSQVPKGLVTESGIPILNKGHVCVTKTCDPPSVHRAFLDQFDSDFRTFLKSRSEELKPGGRMVLTLVSNDRHHPNFVQLTGMTIGDMVSEGLIEESKLESFNLPFYAPCDEEVRQAVAREGSFEIHHFETFYTSWLVEAGFEPEGDEYAAGGRKVAKHARAALEPLLADHFGESVMEDLFQRLAIKVTRECLEMGLQANPNILITLIKKL